MIHPKFLYSTYTEGALKDMHNLIVRLETPSVSDIEEQMQLQSTQTNTRLWYDGDTLSAFCYIDTYNNLRFEVHPDHESPKLFKEIIDWGILCMQKRNAETQDQETLDASCFACDSKRMSLFKEHGFEPEEIRTLNYVRDLSDPIEVRDLPAGFSLTHVAGEHQAEELVTLHRAAFGTDNMSVEERLAMMRVSSYEKELDLLVLSPSGEFVGCCICEIDEDDAAKGWTDPIVVHPNYQGRGVGKALLTEGLNALKRRNISTVMLGTSSQNKAMMRLAEVSGFDVVAEKLWFAKPV